MTVTLFITIGLVLLVWHVCKSMIIHDVQQNLHDRFPCCDESMLKKREGFRLKQVGSRQIHWYQRIAHVGKQLLVPHIRVFVSYHNSDKEFAIELVRALETSWAPSFFHLKPSILGFSFPWTTYCIKCLLIDTDDIVPQTSDLLDRIQTSIRQCDLSILICGDFTATSSWVATETALANSAHKPLLILRRDANSLIPPNLSEGYPIIDVINKGHPWNVYVFRVVEEILYYKCRRRFAFTWAVLFPTLSLMLIVLYDLQQNSIKPQHIILLPMQATFASVVWFFANRSTYIYKWSKGWRFKRFRFTRITDVEDAQSNSQPEDEGGMLGFLRCVKWLVILSKIILPTILIAMFLGFTSILYTLLAAYCAAMLFLFVRMRYYSLRGVRKM